MNFILNKMSNQVGAKKKVKQQIFRTEQVD
jgi:hypothetical protein